MAKKKPLTKSKEEMKKALHKEIVVNLKIKKISNEIYETKKEGVKEILKVAFENASDGIVVALKGSKSSHPLRNWDKRILGSKDDIIMTLSVPSVNQKKITDYVNEENGEED